MRLFGLAGYPLSHSFSAKYFADKFESENIRDASYRLFPLEHITELPELINLHPGLQGLNVTIPYKISVIPFLDHLTEAAKMVGAVNCVKIERDEAGTLLTGHNTDVYGFGESLMPFLKPYHRNALVLGTGGASRAVCYVLQQAGIHFTIVSRTGDGETSLNYSQLTEKIIEDNLLIINTTPLGMYPETDRYPDIPYQFLGGSHLLFDLVYNPAETLFLKKGRDTGSETLNGLRMLELQAEKSWEIWNE